MLFMPNLNNNNLVMYPLESLSRPKLKNTCQGVKLCPREVDGFQSALNLAPDKPSERYIPPCAFLSCDFKLFAINCLC